MQFIFKKIWIVYIAAIVIFSIVLIYGKDEKYKKKKTQEHNVKVRKLLGYNTTNKDLKKLKELTYVSILDLKSKKISNAELATLKPLTNLTYLNLEGTKISDSGLVHLKPLAKLAYLNLAGTKISDSGLIYLKPLTNLKELNLEGTKISDAGLVHLKSLTKLSRLHLNGKISNAGLAHLKSLTNLFELNLIGAKISDAGLVHLKSLTKLCKLNFKGTKVTRVGLEKIHPNFNKLQSKINRYIGWLYSVDGRAGTTAISMLPVFGESILLPLIEDCKLSLINDKMFDLYYLNVAHVLGELGSPKGISLLKLIEQKNQKLKEAVLKAKFKIKSGKDVRVYKNFRVKMVSSQKKYALGETIELAISFTNISNQTISIPHLEKIPHFISYSFVVVDQNGELVQKSRGKLRGHKSSDDVPIKPLETLTFRLNQIQKYYDFSKPSTYRIRAHFPWIDRVDCSNRQCLKIISHSLLL